MTSLRWTVRDLETFPRDDGNRYEIIGGELLVTTQPSLEHQVVSGEIHTALQNWGRGIGLVIAAPGVIFADDDAVAPDLVWVRLDRLPALVGPDRKLHSAPDLMVEILSPGSTNERRDREIKLGLYSRRGVLEYWIVDWVQRRIEVYRRQDAALRLAVTLSEGDRLESPILPGFSHEVGHLFAGLAALGS